MDQLGRRHYGITFSPSHDFDVDDVEKSFFGQDHWIVTPKLAVDLGVRTEAQQISGAIRVAPRAGFSWTPVQSTNTISRGGAGYFFDGCR